MHLSSAIHKRNVATVEYIQPDSSDPNNYCKICKKTSGSGSTCRHHLKRVYKMSLPPLTPTPNFNVKPKPDNPNNYCDSCSWTFLTRRGYRNHLRESHKMAIPPKGRGTPNLNIRPDIDDPDIYCKSCQFKYKCGGVYRGYLKKIRKMEITPPRNKLSLFDPNVSVNDAQDPRNTICAICKRKYSRRSGCLQHMKN